MHFLFMCHAVGMGAGELTPVTGSSTWYFYANTKAVQ